MAVVVAAAVVTPDPDDRATGPGPTPSSPGVSGATGPSLGRATGSPVSFVDLARRRTELVGTTVEVTGRVLFYGRCPPPDQQATGCQLSAYLVEQERDDLQAVDLPDALVLAEGGHPVTCDEGEAVRGACLGWEHDARYRLVGAVVHQVRGGRETSQVELDVKSKTRI